MNSLSLRYIVPAIAIVSAVLFQASATSATAITDHGPFQTPTASVAMAAK